jgi:hypothetical protein
MRLAAGSAGLSLSACVWLGCNNIIGLEQGQAESSCLGDGGYYSYHNGIYQDSCDRLWQTIPAGNTDWDAAVATCAQLDAGNGESWRLPNPQEGTNAGLSWLPPPTLCPPSGDCKGQLMWTCQTFAADDSQAYEFDLLGENKLFPKAQPAAVQYCVQTSYPDPCNP